MLTLNPLNMDIKNFVARMWSTFIDQDYLRTFLNQLQITQFEHVSFFDWDLLLSKFAVFLPVLAQIVRKMFFGTFA